MAGKLCFIPGYAPTLSQKLAPLHRYLDVLLLANSSIAEAAAGKKVKVDRINVNGEECAWVPLNGESMLQQFNAILAANGEDPVSESFEDEYELYEWAVRLLEGGTRQQVTGEAAYKAKIEMLMAEVANLREKEKHCSSALRAIWINPTVAAQDETVTKVVLVLLHGTGLANAQVWQAWLQHKQPEIRAVFHLCSNSSSKPEELPGWEVIRNHLMPERYLSEWGKTSIFTATVQCMGVLLQRYPRTEHIVLASGTHIPMTLAPFAGLKPGISLVPRMLETPGFIRDWAELGLGKLRSTVLAGNDEAAWWANGLVFHHQWCALAADHVRYLCDYKPLLADVAEAVLTKFATMDPRGEHVCVAPDEYAIAMGLYALCIPFNNESATTSPDPGRVLTDKFVCSVFFAEDRTDHPVTFDTMDGGRQVYHKGEYIKRSLLDVMKGAKARGIPFVRKVDIRVKNDADQLLATLKKEYWKMEGGKGQQQEEAKQQQTKKRRKS